MYTEIIKNLRSVQSRSKSQSLNGAIDKLEALQQKLNEEHQLDTEVYLSEQLRQLRIERDMLARKLKEVEAERDAAVAYIKNCDDCEMCKHANSDPNCWDYVFDCEYCTSEICVCRHCRDMDKWEWRGLRNEKEGE